MRSFRHVAALAAALILLASPTAPQSGPGPAKSHVFMADHGVTGNGSVDETAGVLSALGTCATINLPHKGCILVPPVGSVLVTGPIPITHGLTLQGAGPGAIQALPGGTVTNGGTLFKTTCKTCDLFAVVTLDAVTFRDFGIDAPLDATDGHLFRLSPATTPANYQQIIKPTIENVRTIGGWNILLCDLCNAFKITNNVHWSFRMHGYIFRAGSHFSDSGDGQISRVNFWFLMPHDNNVGGACILLATQSGVSITKGKMLSCTDGIRIVAVQGRAGVIQISGMNIEQTKRNALRIEQGECGKSFGGVMFEGNWVQHLSSPTFAAAVHIDQGECGERYVDQVWLNRNRINSGYSPPVTEDPFYFVDPPAPATQAASRCFDIMNGREMQVSDNWCNQNLTTGYGGIRVGGLAQGVAVERNRVINAGSGLPPYEFSVPVFLEDTRSNLTVAQVSPLVPNLLPGSSIYLVDGKSTSWPTNPAVSGGGYGCHASVTSAPGGNVVCVGPQ